MARCDQLPHRRGRTTAGRCSLLPLLFVGSFVFLFLISFSVLSSTPFFFLLSTLLRARVAPPVHAFERAVCVFLFSGARTRASALQPRSLSARFTFIQSNLSFSQPMISCRSPVELVIKPIAASRSIVREVKGQVFPTELRRLCARVVGAAQVLCGWNLHSAEKAVSLAQGCIVVL